MKEKTSLWLLDEDTEGADLLRQALLEECPLVAYQHFTKTEPLFSALAGSPPTYVLLERILPVQSVEHLKPVREQHEHLCLITYSSSNRKEDIHECYRRGANLCVLKPHTYHHLRNQ